MIAKRLAIVAFCVVGVVVAIFAGNLWLFAETPFGREERRMTIEKGSTVGQVAARLEEEGVISNRLLFKVFVFVEGAARDIRAGEFVFPAGIRPSEVLALLKEGDFARYRITIPEGWTLRQIAAYLGEQSLVDPEKFLAKATDPQFIGSLGRDFLANASTLEGFLFPDTYEIYKPKDEEEVIRRLVEQFGEKAGPELTTRPGEGILGRLTEREIVTLASIVEKETGKADERPLIAGVFLNRLERGVALASDPTVIYGISDFSGNLRRADLDRPGPYNTYLNPGLPPTPIANPGLDSIRAVLHPMPTDYFYFVARGDGTHEFSRTQAEHQRAVQRYQINPRARPAP